MPASVAELAMLFTRVAGADAVPGSLTTRTALEATVMVPVPGVATATPLPS